MSSLGSQAARLGGRARALTPEPRPCWPNVGPAIGVLVGFILVRRVLVGGLPEGDDAPYHVAKNAFAFTEIFARGHLDGWGPTFSMDHD